MFVKWINYWRSHTLTRHAQSRITPLVWTSFQRGDGGPTYLLGHCSWLSFTILDSGEEGVVSILTESCFLQKTHDDMWKLQSLWLDSSHPEDAWSLRTGGPVMAPLAHLHFQNPGCRACLHSLTFIITPWGKQSSSSYLTHEEIETVSCLVNGRQNCKVVNSTSHGIRWMWVGFRLCCLLALWLWALTSPLWAVVFSSVKWEWWCLYSQAWGEE